MVDIESHKEADEMRRMHPLWEQYELTQGENGADAPRYFYFNPYNGNKDDTGFLIGGGDTQPLNIYIGKLTLEFPETDSQERGGILADGK